MASLNIKNEEAVRLIKELAELEGQSMTTVVIEAVQDRLDRQRRSREDLIQFWMDFGDRVQRKADPEWLARDQIAELHDDELGLPK